MLCLKWLIPLTLSSQLHLILISVPAHTHTPVSQFHIDFLLYLCFSLSVLLCQCVLATIRFTTVLKTIVLKLCLVVMPCLFI